MKVLIVFNHPAPYKVNIFNEIAKYCDLTVLFERNKAADRPDEFYSVNKYSFKSITLNDGYIGREGSISSGVVKYIKKHHNEFDQIVMNGYSHLAEIKAIKYMNRHNIKYSLLINGGLKKEKENFIKRKFKSSIISSADYYISPSIKADDYLIYYGAEKEKIYHYPYSNLFKREISNSKYDKNELRSQFNLPKDKTIFINASQFIDRKNNLQLLSLFLNSDKYLVLVGEGIEENKYREYISKNKMDNVSIISFKPKNELFNLYKACDVFITLAKEDIFGHTTLEALANGLPVISSNKVISSLEYIKEGVNGYIVSLDDNEKIIKAINKAPELAKEAAIKSVENNTFEACGKRLFEIFEEINQK